MRFYKDSGWGQIQVNGVPFSGCGKLFIVGDASTKNLSMLKELFTPDPNGDVRFFATIDSAIGSCTANAGDVVIVMPGHTETVTAAGGLDLDKAGVTVIGLGSGSDRPTVNFTTAATADVDVDAANVTVENLIFDMTGVDAVAAGIDVNADDFTMRRCRVVMGDSDGQAVVGVLSDTNIDRLTVEGCEFIGDTIAGPAAAIRIIGGVEHRIKGNKIYGNYSQANIALVTTAPLRVDISDNHLVNVNAVDINIIGVANATGQIAENRCEIPTDGESTWINTPGGMTLYENYGVNAAGETGMLIGVASTS